MSRSEGERAKRTKKSKSVNSQCYIKVKKKNPKWGASHFRVGLSLSVNLSLASISSPRKRFIDDNFGLSTMLGRIMHYTADALLFSTLLAGVKRSAGLS